MDRTATPHSRQQSGKTKGEYLARVERLHEKARRRIKVLEGQLCRLAEVAYRCRVIENNQNIPGMLNRVKAMPFRTFEHYEPVSEVSSA